MTTPPTATRRRVLETAGLAFASVSLAGCTGPEGSTDDGNGGGGGGDTTTVDVGPNGEFVFTPGTDEPLRVPSDTEVEFVWKSNTHNVAVESQPDGANWEGHQAIENRGFSFTHTFETRGRYEYFCQPHKSLGMVGEIVVE